MKEPHEEVVGRVGVYIFFLESSRWEEFRITCF